MAMTKCKECKKEVSTNAKTCPNCGVKDPGFTIKDYIFGVIVLIVIVWGVKSYMFEENETTSFVNKTSNASHSSLTDKKIRTIGQVKQGCNSGRGEDCDLLGNAYKYGNGLHIQGFYEKNEIKAVQYYQKAFKHYKESCEGTKEIREQAIDCYEAGSYYRDDYKGVFKQNFSKAFQYFYKSCELGVSISCGIVAAYYEKGLGVKQNFIKSVEYYRKDCELGEIRSCNKLKVLE